MLSTRKGGGGRVSLSNPPWPGLTVLVENTDVEAQRFISACAIFSCHPRNISLVVPV